MDIKIYEELPQEAIAIRTKVFVEEQGFKEEFDGIDHFATHIVLFEDNAPVATGRFFYSEEKACFMIGRLAVYKEFRGKNYGAAVLEAAEAEIAKRGGSSITLSAQMRVSAFYEKLGYKIKGEPYLDEGCPHISMYKKIKD